MGRRYTLTMRLEEGALAELYKAKADGPGAPEVLVKLFNPRLSDPAYAKALADVGARTLSLGHPQALAYDEVGMVGGRIAVVRPYFEGFSLGDAMRRLMSKEVVLPPALALYLVVEAAQVVAQAHARGWAHGAITPGNILLGFDGKVRVTDFGALEAMNASAALKALAAKGRHAYRAPEQRDPGAGKPEGDVYSLGAIVYELLTMREVAQSRGGGLSTKRDSLPAPSRVDRRLNPRMDPAVMRALELAPARRYRSAAEYSEALRGLFSVLGYAPGLNEAVRFVKELFPNEVTIGGLGGELPIKSAFELEQFFGALPAAGLDPVGEFAERSPFTSADFEEVEPEAPAPAPAAASFAAAPGAAPAADFESWEAPPGQMPEAPRLARRSAQPAEPGSRSELESESAGPGFDKTFMREAAPPDLGLELPAEPRPERAPLQTPVERPASLEGLSDSGLGSTKQRTNLDWHVPPPKPKQKPPAPRVGVGVWLLGLVGCALASALVYLAVSKKLGLDPVEPPALNLLSPVGELRPPAAPVAAGQQAAAAPATLSIEAEVAAAVFIDGRDTGKTLPLIGHALPAGKHTVLLVHGEAMREFMIDLAPGQDEKRVESFAAKPPRKRLPTKKSRRQP